MIMYKKHPAGRWQSWDLETKLTDAFQILLLMKLKWFLRYLQEAANLKGNYQLCKLVTMHKPVHMAG